MQQASLPLAGRFALVTGGSGGIGAATVRQLAEAGATVAVGYLAGHDRAQALAADLPGSGHVAVSVPMTDVPAQEAAAADLMARWGRLDVLVNAGGYTRRIAHNDLAALDPALFNELLAVNAGGPYAVIRACLPLLRASGQATVVNISSVSGFTGQGSNIAYCAAKAALDVMGVSLARALGPGIRVLSVSPAAVATDFVPGRDRAEVERRAAHSPLGRVVEAEDVARAALACVTHLQTATGTRIVIDGGHSL